METRTGKARMRAEKTSTPACVFNVGVGCEFPKRGGCGSCGWNPTVQRKRIAALRGETDTRPAPTVTGEERGRAGNA